MLFVLAPIVLILNTQFLYNYSHLQQHLFLMTVSTAPPVVIHFVFSCITHYHFAGAVVVMNMNMDNHILEVSNFWIFLEIILARIYFINDSTANSIGHNCCKPQTH